MGETVVDAPETDERIYASLPVIQLLLGGLHNLKRAFEKLCRQVRCGGERVGDIVPADLAGVEKPFRLNSVLPPGATISKLSNKVCGMSGDKVSISELRGHAFFYFVQGAKVRNRMHIEL